MTRVTFGNPSPQMQITQDDGTTISQPAAHLSVSVTSADMWDGFDDPDLVAAALSTDNDPILWMIGQILDQASQQYAVGVHELLQIVAVHTGGQKPAWIASDDPTFESVLSTYFNCPAGDPSMLLTNGGRDALHAQVYSSTQPAPFNYMALTASTTTPSASDTTLAGEITTASGGLIRALATFAHTAGTNTSTLTKSFVANGSDSLPVTIAQMGTFNASSGGTLGNHTALSATATLSSVGDSVSVTDTPTIG